ncbi:MAG: hypothetical protein ACOYM2_05415 [Rectinemataceae bacterium]
MEISAANFSTPSIQQFRAPRGEEAGEVASSPAEEAGEKGRFMKSAEQAQGLGTKIDLMA